MIKALRQLIILLFAITFLVSCSDDGSADSSGIVKIGVAHCCSTSDLFLDGIFNIYEKEGRENPNIDLQLLRANDNQPTQIRQVEQLIASGVQALVLTFVADDDKEHKHEREILQKAKDANIPVVLYVIHTDKTTFSKFNNTYFVGSIPAQSGIYQGELIVDAWTENPSWDKNGDGTIQYVILKGIPGNPDADGRTKWVSGTIENYPGKGVKAELLDLVPANWRKVQAEEVVSNWLNSDIGQRMEVIIANNDGMALGAIEAMKKMNVSLPIVGVDAIPEALQAIKSGDMLGTVKQDGASQAREALNLAVNLAAGKSLKSNTQAKVVNRELMVPYVPISIKNIDNYIE